MDSEQLTRREKRLRRIGTFLAYSGFLVLVVGISYFAALVVAVQFGGAPDARFAAFRQLGLFLSGGLDWYQDARVFGAAALLLALSSTLFRVHPFARITIPVAGVCYAVLHVYGDAIREILSGWAVKR